MRVAQRLMITNYGMANKVIGKLQFKQSDLILLNIVIKIKLFRMKLVSLSYK